MASTASATPRTMRSSTGASPNWVRRTSKRSTSTGRTASSTECDQRHPCGREDKDGERHNIIGHNVQIEIELRALVGRIALSGSVQRRWLGVRSFDNVGVAGLSTSVTASPSQPNPPWLLHPRWSDPVRGFPGARDYKTVSYENRLVTKLPDLFARAAELEAQLNQAERLSRSGTS